MAKSFLERSLEELSFVAAANRLLFAAAVTGFSPCAATEELSLTVLLRLAMRISLFY